MIRNKDYFSVGKTYNREYFGDNLLYKEQNGSTTFLLLSIEENGEIKYKDLFATHPSDLKSEKLYSNPITWNIKHLIESQHEYKYTLVEDQKDFFIHSKRTTVNEAVKEGLVSIDTIKYIFKDQSNNFIKRNPITTHSLENDYFLSLQISVKKGVSKNKYLQTVVFVWDSQKQMKQDVTSVFKDAYFLH